MSQYGWHQGTPEPDTAGRTDGARGVSPEAAHEEECELCGAAMYGLHCKLICSNCGYRRDCSDP